MWCFHCPPTIIQVLSNSAGGPCTPTHPVNGCVAGDPHLRGGYCHELYFPRSCHILSQLVNHSVCLSRHPSLIIEQFVSHQTVPRMVIQPQHLSRHTIQATLVENVPRYTHIYVPHWARTSDTKGHVTCFSIVSAWQLPVLMQLPHAEP